MSQAAQPAQVGTCSSQGSDCTLCRGALVDPVILPCGHIMCAHCFDALASCGGARACIACRAPLPIQCPEVCLRLRVAVEAARRADVAARRVTLEAQERNMRRMGNQLGFLSAEVSALDSENAGLEMEVDELKKENEELRAELEWGMPTGTMVGGSHPSSRRRPGGGSQSLGGYSSSGHSRTWSGSSSEGRYAHSVGGYTSNGGGSSTAGRTWSGGSGGSYGHSDRGYSY